MLDSHTQAPAVACGNEQDLGHKRFSPQKISGSKTPSSPFRSGRRAAKQCHKRKCLRVLAKSIADGVSCRLPWFRGPSWLQRNLIGTSSANFSFELEVEIQRLGSRTYLFVALNIHNLQSNSGEEFHRLESG